MNTEMHGKKVSSITLSTQEVIASTTDAMMELSATYHGDHDEFWIVQIGKDGKEIARHNCRNIESIVWL